MLTHPVALDASEHARWRLRPQRGFPFAAGLHMASVMQPEFRRVSVIYPIVFVEDTEFDAFRPMALFGLKTGENLFVGPDGHWDAPYVPAVVRAYPFALARAADGDRLAVCIDASAHTVCPTDGVPLFEDDGQPAAALRDAKAFLSRLRQMQVLTDAFSRALAERNLFTPFAVRARRGSEIVEVDGCYVVDEERLDRLSDARLSGLRERGWLAAVYAHLVSLLQLDRLSHGPSGDPAARSPMASHGVHR